MFYTRCYVALIVMSDLNFIKRWEVIDLLDLCEEISKGDRKHPVYKEQQYQLNERSKGNDRANLEWVGHNEHTPIINEYLLNCGFNHGDKVLFWVCF